MSYIIFDLDETLLDSERQVTEYTKSVLEKLRECGHKIVINTARSKILTDGLIQLIRPDFTILCAGAGILDAGGRYIYKCEIPKETVEAISRELSSRGRLFSIQADPYFHTNNPQFIRYDTVQFNPECFTYDFDSPKLVANLGEGGDAEAEYFASKYGIDTVRYFDGPLYRFSHKDATKAKGNSALVRIHGDSERDIIAFGDDNGDVDMLLEAGLGVIMKNARDEIKAKIRHVTEYTNNENGVARFLVKHFDLNM